VNAILILWSRKLLFTLSTVLDCSTQSTQKGNSKEGPHHLESEASLVEESKEEFSHLPFAYKTWNADNTVQPNYSTLKIHSLYDHATGSSSFSVCKVLHWKIYARKVLGTLLL